MLSVRERVSAARVGILGTLGPGGAPHLVPFCFVLEGDVIYSATDQKPKRTNRLARFLHVERDPRVSVLVENWSEDWERLWWVRMDGRARVLGGGGADAAEAQRALALLTAKYAQYRERPPAGPVLAIAIERYRSWPESP
ncbi:MAG TPA: TIGR03668 family PPOX class F420-dependent oxidoreductase [Candidatus Dormibacteraeota bacterium]